MSSREKTQRNILRISIMATIILIASVVWVNFERNIRYGDKTLQFDNQPLAEVFQRIEETYQVEINIKDTDLSNCLLSTTFQDKTLEEVMNALRIRYRLEMERTEKRKFVISGAKC
ncbi:MAG: DUF4974 domain-containing protein [Saprospiraceae bacterium]